MNALRYIFLQDHITIYYSHNILSLNDGNFMLICFIFHLILVLYLSTHNGFIETNKNIHEKRFQ